MNNTCYAIIDWAPTLKKNHLNAVDFCSTFSFDLFYLENEEQRENVVSLMGQAKVEANSFWITGSFNNSRFLLVVFINKISRTSWNLTICPADPRVSGMILVVVSILYPI